MPTTRFTIAGIGELLWDVLSGAEILGGAPVNFCFQAQSHGNLALPIATIGEDKRGRLALSILSRNGLDTGAITTSSDHETGYVRVDIHPGGHASYYFPEDVAWDYLHINSYAKKKQGTLHAVCFGTLGQRNAVSQWAIYRFIEGCPDQTIRVYDVNLRQNFYSKEIIEKSLALTDILKINDEELEVIGILLNLPSGVKLRIKTLIERYGLTMVILTRGHLGALITTAQGSSDHSGYPCEVVDTIGAGDAFCATATIGYLLGKSIDEINDHANRVASYVSSQRGAMVVLPEELKLSG